MKNRHFSLLIPWFMDGSFGLVMLATPLLAIRYGASALMLGTIGWVPQLARLPLCLTSGHLSERFGRKTIIIPAGLLLAAGAIGVSLARTNWQIILPYTMLVAAAGAFYPPLQALVGDVSRQGELTTNLGRFNIGWCVGGTVFAVLGTWLVSISLYLVFYVAAAGMLTAVGFILLWPTGKQLREATAPEDIPTGKYPPGLLPAARLALFIGFFGEVAIRVLYPKLATELGWSESLIAWVMAAMVAGTGTSMIGCNVSAWWRGKFWPQMAALGLYIAAGLGAAVLKIPVLVGTCFFFIGLAVGVAYTAALYHGLADRRARGKNTGMHESIIASAGVSACLLGGFIADKLALSAPYFVFSAFSAAALVWVIKLSRDS